MRVDNLKQGELAALTKRVRALETQSSGGHSSVSRGRTRFIGNESLVVEGSQKVTGWLVVTGTLRVVGAFLLEGITTVSGAFTSTGTFTARGRTRFEGDTTQVGPFHVQGNADVTGTLGIKGASTLESDLTVTNGGKILVPGAEPMTVGPVGSGNAGVSWTSGGQVTAGSGGVVMQGAGGTARVSASGALASMSVGTKSVSVSGTQTTVNGTLSVIGSFSADSKSFNIPHPTKPGMRLWHGVTESPVHGVEYWGEETLDESGRSEVTLPDYFEALTREDGRTVFVTGRGFAPDWSDVDGREFTVTGKPHGKFSWLVKAARSDVDLVVEQLQPEPQPQIEDQTAGE